MPRKSDPLPDVEVMCLESEIEAFVPLHTYTLRRSALDYGKIKSGTTDYHFGRSRDEWYYGARTRFTEVPQH